MKLRIKNYSTDHPELDTLLNSAYTSGYLKAQKEFTKWDETDNLKRAKDSDILAEEEKKKPGVGRIVSAGVAGGATGAAAGVGAHVTSKIIRKHGKGEAKNIASKIAKRGGKKNVLLAAGLGAATLAAGATNKRHKEVEEVNHYNRRLKYAKRQALRRESKDWRNNMTNGREEYSY